MKSIILKSYAKINLSIDVKGKRDDGYHEVEMVMQQIDLYDKVTVTWEAREEDCVGSKKEPVEIQIETNLSYLPVNEKNIAYKAAALMAETYLQGKRGIIGVKLEKHVPVSAGLAGGSANGAAVIHGLSKLWELHLPMKRLQALGTQLGADVPFCIMGQGALNKELGFSQEENSGTCAIARGIGEELEVIPGIKSWVLLVKPPISVSTAHVYGKLNIGQIEARPDTVELVEGLKQRNYQKITKNMMNVLENVSLKEYPVIVYTKNNMQKTCKGKKILMSGSGPTLFTLYPTKAKGKSAYEKMKSQVRETYLVRSL
ncbi:MAG: 4-(cytidine 5'-diphospho)-2-C-methyl-D-erythritol kinase [Anaerovorax sp.]